MQTLHEPNVNLVSRESRLEGKLQFEATTRVLGHLSGEVVGMTGSTLIFADSSVIEGKVHGSTIIIDGYVKGDVTASERIVVSRGGRVIGDLTAPSVKIEVGAHFEGRCTTS
jgi:cytoskeletal protein CcmA (bactofilin family)